MMQVMTYDEYNAYCATFAGTSYVVQWGGAHVWKVGGKVFAIGGWEDEDEARITFKVTELAYEILSDTEGCQPAPYLASRGMKWIQVYNENVLSREDVFNYIAQSYELVAAKLTKKKRKEIGLD